ncbi:MAG: MFS transporter [Bdellovibrionales bacterium]|nr:MFS transporter [Bdellovibrionales bacterium]
MAERHSTTRLPRGVWALGFVSLFMDISSEAIHGLLPVFLVSVLSASVVSVGILEGLAEAVALVMKVFSGPLSDWLGRRKPVVLLGYSMGALSKPFFAIAGSVSVVYGARLFDRMGKGIRGAPRDALVADLAPKELRGRAFGLRQSLDTVGAFLGPSLAMLLMYLTHNHYRTVFWLATIPAVLSVFILYFGVREKKEETAEDSSRRLQLSELKTFSSSFWLVVGAGAVFQLARFSEAFLILRARDFGVALAFSPVVLIVMNIVYSASSYPVGLLSDRIRREWLLLVGLLILCASDLLLATATGLLGAFFGIALWGLHMGFTQGILAALVADTAKASRRGTAYGIFNLFSALALLLASTLAGFFWQYFGARVTFFVGAGLSLLSFGVFFSLRGLWGKR